MNERIEQIVGEALEHPAEARAAFLDEACGGDAALRREAESLLRAIEAAGDFLAHPTPPGLAEGTAPPSTMLRGPTERVGAMVGRYKLLQRIGEGGFGVVYMAEQREPVRRKVALKIIKLGMDTKQTLARFEAERQALAMMDHPHIARVFDAGATESGRPYFVMELVTGKPITEYCDLHQLNIIERLKLFEQVCHAVQHAHTKGVIHRDLKPGNVLVNTQDGQPHARVIDFGIAKATAAPLTERTLFTEHGQFIGTPQYMSPEQAEGSLDIDTRTDVYSLGVLLYELLTGTTPFDPAQLRVAAFAEMVRILREVEPPKPSTRVTEGTKALRHEGTKEERAGGAASGPSPLSTIARLRHTDPRMLVRTLRGDLDWMVMKCLDKDRRRRYETAGNLAADLERYMTDQPVTAGPPSPLYRMGKFAKRNKGLLAATGAVAAALILGLAATTYGFLQANRARAVAVMARQAAEEQRIAAETARARESAEKERAQTAEAEATKQRNAAEYRASAANVLAAHAAIGDGDTASAKLRLEDCPERFRNWEWRYVHARCDQSLRSVRVSESAGVKIFPNPAGLQLVASCDDGAFKLLTFPALEEIACARPAPGETVLKSVVHGNPRVTFSPDGTRFLTVYGGCKAPAQLWDAADGHELPGFRMIDNFGGDGVFGPDSRRLVTFDREQTHAELWDAVSGAIIVSLDLGPDCPRGAAFLPDLERLVLATSDGGIRVYCSENGRELQQIAADCATIDSLQASPNGLYYVTFGGDTSFCVWDARQLTPLFQDEIYGGGYPWMRTAWSEDSSLLVVASLYSIGVWQVPEGLRQATCRTEYRVINLLKFAPDGRQVIIRHSNMAPIPLELWNAQTGDHVCTLGAPYAEDMQCGAFSPDSVYVASGSDYGTLQIWKTGNEELATGQTCKGIPYQKAVANLYGHEGSISSVMYAKDGQTLLTSSLDGTIRVWDPKQRDGPMYLDTYDKRYIRTNMVFSHDGRHVFAGSDGATVRVWDADSGRQTAFFDAPVWEQHDDGHYPEFTALNSDGTRLAVGTPAAGATVLDVATGYPLGRLRWNGSRWGKAALSPDLSRAAVWNWSDPGQTEVWYWRMEETPSPGKGVVIFDTGTGMRLCWFPEYEPSDVAFTRDGTRLVVALGNVARIVDVSTARELCTLNSAAEIQTIAFDPTGTRVALGSTDHRVRIFDANTGTPLHTLGNHTRGVHGLAYSPDGTRLASSDGVTVKLWDMTTGAELLALRHRVRQMNFSADGTRLAIRIEPFGADGAVIDTRSPAERARERKDYESAQTQSRRLCAAALADSGDRIIAAAAQLRNDKTLPEVVRQVAMDELMQICLDRLRRLEKMYDHLVFTSDVVAAVNRDESLSAGLRADLTEIAQWRGDPPTFLDDAAWQCAAHSNGTREDYHLALRAAEAAEAGMNAVRRADHHSILNTLGVARYRVGDYEGARSALQRSMELNAAAGFGEEPADLAFLAMSSWRLGRHDEARALLVRCRDSVSERGDTESQTFLAEAEALIEPE